MRLLPPDARQGKCDGSKHEGPEKELDHVPHHPDQNGMEVFPMSVLRSFPPVANEHSSVLILGTMPSAMSLEKNQNYANPRNLFWRLIYAAFGEPEVPAGYDERIRFLLQKGIALWDVYAQCERTSSLDSNIKHEILNDFPGFLASHPNLRCLAFNGSRAYKAFSGAVPCPEHLSILRLPSSSPAHTTMSFQEKLSKWKQIANYCD